MTVGFRPSHSRPKSFILSADLEEKRHRIKQNPSIQRSLSINKLTPPTRQQQQKQPSRNRPISREEIENRWTKLMENDEIFQKSIKGKDERDALR